MLEFPASKPAAGINDIASGMDGIAGAMAVSCLPLYALAVAMILHGEMLTQGKFLGKSSFARS